MSKFTDFLKNNKSDIFKPIIVLLAICIVIPLALSLTNELTADRIAKLAAENEKATMSQLIEAETFDKHTFTSTSKEEKFDFYIAKSQDEVKGYIFVTSAKGYGGEVSVMTAIGTDGKVKEISILDAANETPGLGQNVTKENFYSQFKNKVKGVTVVKNGADSANNEVNAVTGATISSRAVTTAVNEALENFSEYSNAVFKDTEVETNEK